MKGMKEIEKHLVSYSLGIHIIPQYMYNIVQLYDEKL